MSFKTTAIASGMILSICSAPVWAQDTPATQPSRPTTPAAPVQQAKPALPPKPIEGQIVMQSADTVLASTLIGATVTGQGGEDTASIKDVIIKTDGTIDGVVIGVGGFLGIGEHQVAVKWDKIQLQEASSGRTKVLLTATREDLKAAQPFKSKDQAESERQAEIQRQQQPARAPVAPTATPPAAPQPPR